jgi:hypothetical protein
MKTTLSEPHRELTSELASENFRQFMDSVNYQIFSKSFQCLGNALEIIAVKVVGPEADRFRYYVLVECPEKMDAATFCGLLRDSWYRTDWSDSESDMSITEMANANDFVKYADQ